MSETQRCDNVTTTLSDVATKIQSKPNVVTTSCASWDLIKIHLQLVIQKPFCELLNVKLFKRQTPTPPEVLCKKGVLKSFSKFTGKHLCWGLFISGDFFKKWLQHWCFFMNFADFSVHLSCRHLRTAASAWIFLKNCFKNFKRFLKAPVKKFFLYILKGTWHK